MGALPKRRISSGRKNRRRAQDGLKSVSSNKCPKCGNPKKPHFECKFCGYYEKKSKDSNK